MSSNTEDQMTFSFSTAMHQTQRLMEQLSNRMGTIEQSISLALKKHTDEYRRIYDKFENQQENVSQAIKEITEIQHGYQLSIVKLENNTKELKTDISQHLEEHKIHKVTLRNLKWGLIATIISLLITQIIGNIPKILSFILDV